MPAPWLARSKAQSVGQMESEGDRNLDSGTLDSAAAAAPVDRWRAARRGARWRAPPLLLNLSATSRHARDDAQTQFGLSRTYICRRRTWRVRTRDIRVGIQRCSSSTVLLLLLLLQPALMLVYAINGSCDAGMMEPTLASAG